MNNRGELKKLLAPCFPIHLPQESLCLTGHVVAATSCARRCSLLSFSSGSSESGNGLFSLLRHPENKPVKTIMMFNSYKITTQKNNRSNKQASKQTNKWNNTDLFNAFHFFSQIFCLVSPAARGLSLKFEET